MIRKAFAFAAAFAFIAVPVFAVTSASPDGSMKLEAQTISGDAAGRMVADGKARVHYADKVSKTSLDADAAKMIVATMLVPAASGVKGAKPHTAIKTAVLNGPVKMVYSFVDANGTSKITATADSAEFDGVANQAHLSGNVKVIDENPALYAEPPTMIGDKATINLKPGPDDFRFRVESSPGVSTLTATPKPKEQGTGK